MKNTKEDYPLLALDLFTLCDLIQLRLDCNKAHRGDKSPYDVNSFYYNCELPEQLTRFGRELVIQILYQSGFFNTFCGIAVEKSGAMWYYLAG